MKLRCVQVDQNPNEVEPILVPTGWYLTVNDIDGCNGVPKGARIWGVTVFEAEVFVYYTVKGDTPDGQAQG